MRQFFINNNIVFVDADISSHFQTVDDLAYPFAARANPVGNLLMSQLELAFQNAVRIRLRQAV